MNFNHLEYAVAISKYGSISKASQKLFMSQPYLSGMIKGLEEELGYKIFDRNTNGITLTREGGEFIKSAQLILLELKKIKELNMENEEKQLNISCYYATIIMDKFLKFRNSSPLKLSDKIREMGNREAMESVLSGESTMGIIFYAYDKRDKYQKMAEELGLQISELFEPMTVYAVMSENHPLANLPGLNIDMLGQYPYVSFDDASSKKYLTLLGIENHPQLLEVSDRGSFYDALMSGEYLSIMAYRHKRQRSGLVILPFLDKKLLMYSSYVTAKNYKLTHREREFLMFLQNDSENQS